MHDTATQSGVLSLSDEIFFRDQNAVSEADLFLSFFLLVERVHAVLGIDDSYNRIEAVVLGDVIVHEKRLTNRAWVGHAGSFNDDAFEFQLATFMTLAQIEQGAHQIATHGAAHTTVGQLDDFLVLILYEQVVVDALGSEFVFDDRDTLTVVLRQNAFQQRGFARTEKAGEDGDGDHLVEATRGIHGHLTSKTGKSAGLRIGAQSKGERRITAQPKPWGKH